MKALRLVIHGGMHKTGTTSLQRLLSDHRATLAEAGVCYPGTGVDHAGALNMKLHDGLSPGCAGTVRQARDAGAHTLLMSAEAVSTLSDGQFARLRQSFAGLEIEFVFCFRHWAGYLPSRWAQYARRRDSQTFEQYVAAVEASADHVDRRFDLVLERARGHGRVTAVSFDNALARDGSAIPALVRAIGLPDPLHRTLDGATYHENAGAPWQQIALVRLLNGVLAQRQGLRQDDLFLSHGEHRNCARIFGLLGRVARLPQGVVQPLMATVEGYRTVQVVPLGREFREVEDVLASRFAPLFDNLADGRVFPPREAARATCAAIDWQTFHERHRELVEPALRLLDDATAGEAR